MPKHTEKHWRKQVDEIMDNFEFSRMHTCMEALGWHWADCKGVPTESEIRAKARDLMYKLVDDKVSPGTATGGLHVEIDREDGYLSLEFIVESWSAPCD